MSDPQRIMAVRHGQSEANLAFGESVGVPLVYEREDHEITLTELGRSQAAALGAVLRSLPEGEAPEIVWCSPYLRALDTWSLAHQAWGVGPLPVRVDARLRDREWGDLRHCNRAAMEQRFPEETARLLAEGEYGYRPPGGESFGDVAVRLRRFLGDLRGWAEGRRVLIVAHDSVVLILRHVIEESPDTELAAVHVHAPIMNASVSTWASKDGRLELLAFNEVGHLG
ncbi:histidine phosphatase family protein [Nonomuraea sp. NPDC049152]|uniref:histidine phosphatase family protein n=1 Tax=Nonomuraea sp. NPDC049152 TaxID=3154350 RepID=UPI0034058F7A